MIRKPFAHVRLERSGTRAGDVIALAKMATNRSYPEPTHELQEHYTEGLGPGWETLDVGSEATMRREAQQLRNGRRRRVVERT